MSAVAQVTKTGPRTYTPAEPILGGQLVEARAGSRIGVAAAGTVRGLGVALTDAQSPDAFVSTPVIVAGRPVLNAAVLPTVVAVAYGGIETPVVYAGAAAFGQKLIAAANGQVTPFVPAPATAPAVASTPDQIVGVCTAPAGVAAAGAVGLMRTI